MGQTIPGLGTGPGVGLDGFFYYLLFYSFILESLLPIILFILPIILNIVPNILIRAPIREHYTWY